MRAEPSVTSGSTQVVVLFGHRARPERLRDPCSGIEAIEPGDAEHLRVADTQQVALDRARHGTDARRRSPHSEPSCTRPGPCLARRCAHSPRAKSLLATGRGDDDRRQRHVDAGESADRIEERIRGRNAFEQRTDRPCRSGPRVTSLRARQRSCRRRPRSPTWGTTASPHQSLAPARLVSPPLVRSLVL